MFLIVGLGNPGKKYEKTRHNLGYRVIDALKQRLAIGDKWLAVLYKPSSFMNLSGIKIKKKINSMHLDPKNMIVIYDDLDLPLGDVRFKEKGSSAGHRGMQSIIDEFGTEEFKRLRLGIGRPRGNKSAEEYVLENFSPEEEKIISKMIDKSVEIVIQFLENQD